MNCIFGEDVGLIGDYAELNYVYMGNRVNIPSMFFPRAFGRL